MARIMSFPFALLGSAGLACSVFAFTGCSGGSGSNSQVEQVDPRYSTHHALTDHINATVADVQTGNVGAVRELMAVYYAETDIQRRIQGMFEHGMAAVDLIAQANQKFPGFAGDRANSEGKGPPVAHIVREDGQRAYAEMSDGETTTELQLVQIGDRWWISGYTFEHQPEFQQMIVDGKFSAIEAFASSVGSEARNLQSRLSSGEFASEEELSMALLGSFMGLAMQHPEMKEVFESLPGGGLPMGPGGEGPPPGFGGGFGD